MATSDREKLTEFWAKYRHSPDDNAMMLNEKADILKEADCEDIWRSLPDVKDMHVVDIGAGIGRFTREFAKRARSVLAVDFIDSFIEKNRELHSHLSNVRYEINDATHLQLPTQSVEFVFTNWLLMYLNDNECVSFLHNVFHWLRPNGYLHVRESCSQPSASKKAGEKFHIHSNPTFYRQKSQYLRLMSLIADYCEETGKWYRLQPLWATSVPTYIALENNWRQCHMLMRKVECEPCTTLSDDKLVTFFGHDVIEEQWAHERAWNKCKQACDGKSTCIPHIDEALLKAFSGVCGFGMLVHVDSNMLLQVDPIALSNATGKRIWSVYTSVYAYRTTVTDLNNAKEQNLRAQWSHDCTDLHLYYEKIFEWMEDCCDVIYIAASDEQLADVLNSLRRMPCIRRNCTQIVVALRTTEPWIYSSHMSITGNMTITKLHTQQLRQCDDGKKMCANDCFYMLQFTL